jgi:hypothetical protein
MKRDTGVFFCFVFFDELVKSPEAVTPAQAGVHNPLKQLDPRLRGDDEKITSKTFYERIFSFHVKENEREGKCS